MQTHTRGREEVGYGVAFVSRIDKIIGLFCKRALLKRRYSAKETYNFICPTDRSHPIVAAYDVRPHTHTDTHAHRHTDTHAHTRVRVRVRIHTHMHTHMHTHKRQGRSKVVAA